ncbi:MAG TPA: ABC transporter ATP-binding protein [Terriglobia bacterium]|nr:ABC transporter ATP-binding protein [Terriglobia bacterium]
MQTTAQSSAIDSLRPTPDSLLQVESVSYRYSQFELATTSFEARPGELLAIIGPNGSGKSTLLDIASGHLKPLTGAVRLGGEDLHRLSPRRRAQLVGLARQDTPLLFSFQVREFVRQGRHPHLGRGLFETETDEQWVEWALEKTSLVKLAGRRITEISGGEFQRAVLARTLAQRPRLLLLDEPTANLDIGYQIEMLGLVRNLAASENFAAFIVTHELNLAAELAHSLLLLESGRCLCQGTPEDVLKSDLLSRVFRTPVAVDHNPASGRPRVTWAMGPAS